jgi:TRAP-type C4-dicarboxylate transport system substrate-binding protein
MRYFYDAQAWLPKNVTFLNQAAFDRLDQPTQQMLLRVSAAAEARGWWRSQERTKWYGEQLAARGLKVLPPSPALKEGLHRIGEQLTREWLQNVGADGQAVIAAYKKLGT